MNVPAELGCARPGVLVNVVRVRIRIALVDALDDMSVAFITSVVPHDGKVRQFGDESASEAARSSGKVDELLVL